WSAATTTEPDVYSTDTVTKFLSANANNSSQHDSIAGAISGRMTRRTVCMKEAPCMRAASSSSELIWTIVPFMVRAPVVSVVIVTATISKPIVPYTGNGKRTNPTYAQIRPTASTIPGTVTGSQVNRSSTPRPD